jgi:hypothetical protein
MSSFQTKTAEITGYTVFQTVNEKLINIVLGIFNFREFPIFRLCALNLLRYVHA